MVWRRERWQKSVCVQERRGQDEPDWATDPKNWMGWDSCVWCYPNEWFEWFLWMERLASLNPLATGPKLAVLRAPPPTWGSSFQPAEMSWTRSVCLVPSQDSAKQHQNCEGQEHYESNGNPKGISTKMVTHANVGVPWLVHVRLNVSCSWKCS